MTELQHHEKQVILYTKGWFERTSDVIEDLKVIYAKYFGSEPQYYSDMDIYRLLVKLVFKTTEPHRIEEFMIDMMNRWHRCDLRKAIELLHGVLSGLMVLDKNGNIILDLGESDYNILSPKKKGEI